MTVKQPESTTRSARESYALSPIRAAAVATVFVGLTAVAWAGQGKCLRTANDVPFFGAFIGIPNVELDLATGVQAVQFHGVGVANGMDDVLCSSLDEKAHPFPTPDPSVGTPTSGQPNMLSGTYRILGDGGDPIVIWIHAPAEKHLFSQATGHLDFSGSFTAVPRGPGRCRNAAGSGTYAGSADAHPATGIPVNGLLERTGEGRWALWGRISGVECAPNCGRQAEGMPAASWRACGR